MAKKPNRPKRIRLAFQVSTDLNHRIEAAHERMTEGRSFANLSDTCRALIEAGLERDEANAADVKP